MLGHLIIQCPGQGGNLRWARTQNLAIALKEESSRGSSNPLPKDQVIGSNCRMIHRLPIHCSVSYNKSGHPPWRTAFPDDSYIVVEFTWLSSQDAPHQFLCPQRCRCMAHPWWCLRVQDRSAHSALGSRRPKQQRWNHPHSKPRM